MTLKYSVGFLIASLVQAGIVMLSEALGVSMLNAKFTAMQLATHIVVGQILGYLLLFLISKLELGDKTNLAVTGSITGVVAWGILLPINSALGKVNAPWEQGMSTVLSTLIAFIAFGIIATYTIKTFSYSKVE